MPLLERKGNSGTDASSRLPDLERRLASARVQPTECPYICLTPQRAGAVKPGSRGCGGHIALAKSFLGEWGCFPHSTRPSLLCSVRILWQPTGVIARQSVAKHSPS